MRTIRVYFPRTTDNVLEMKFEGGAPSEISGVGALLQNIVLFMKTKPGSDTFNPGRGTFLGDKEILGVSGGSLERLKVMITDAVDKTQTYFLNEQSKRIEDPNSPPLNPDETLVGLELSEITANETDLAIILVEILVHTEGNKTYFLTV